MQTDVSTKPPPTSRKHYSTFICDDNGNIEAVYSAPDILEGTVAAKAWQRVRDGV